MAVVKNATNKGERLHRLSLTVGQQSSVLPQLGGGAEADNSGKIRNDTE